MPAPWHACWESAASCCIPWAECSRRWAWALAAARWEGSAPVARLPLAPGSLAALEAEFAALEAAGRRNLRDQGYMGDTVTFQRRLDLRYAGTEHALSVPRPENGDWPSAFRESHRRLYGYDRPGRDVEILQMRVEAAGEAEALWPRTVQPQGGQAPVPARTTEMWLRERGDRPGSRIPPGGYPRRHDPARTRADPGRRCDRGFGSGFPRDDGRRRPIAAGDGSRPPERSRDPDRVAAPVLLELFNHAFMAVAEHMGRILQRTALSTNIKERLISPARSSTRPATWWPTRRTSPCIWAPWGKACAMSCGPGPGPCPGTSSRPIIPTGAAPIFPISPWSRPCSCPGNRASRRGPAGSRDPAIPGRFSSPPAAPITRTWAASLPDPCPPSPPAWKKKASCWTRKRSWTRDDFGRKPAQPSSHRAPPARNPADNLADLQAQAAANQAGVRMLLDLVAEHGLGKVREQMERLRANASRQVREALARLSKGDREGAGGANRSGEGKTIREFADALDDGTPIRVRITLEGEGATVDFTGSGARAGVT